MSRVPDKRGKSRTVAAERRITSLAKHENPARACNVRAAKVGEAARAGGRDWDALPILMVLEFGDRNGHALGCQKEVKGRRVCVCS